jgi:hypothetical protein
MSMHLGSSVGVEALVRVADERQACRIVVVASLCSLSPICSAGVVLVDFINGEIGSIDVRVQLWLERCPNPTQSMPVNAAEEGMLLDLASATNAAKAIVGIADQARKKVCQLRVMARQHTRNSPPNEVFCLGTQLLVWWEMQVSWPVNNLTVCVVWLFGAERRPADKALEHDGAHGPPIAAEVVSLSTEDLWRYVVGSTHSRVG